MASSVDILSRHLPETEPTASAQGTTIARGPVWLFSRPVDLSVFLGSALVAMAALFVGARAGVLYGDTPDWAWVPAVLCIDVAHVYATGFRVYLDGAEFKRRAVLYWSVPILALAGGVILYAQGAMVFWRALAYLAVFHFVRQQYGWVALYRARANERSRLGRYIDGAAIYLATIYPLIYWHTHLPRRFWWFLANDFAPAPMLAVAIVRPFYWLALALYAGRSLYRGFVKSEWNPGKDIVVVTTAICWYVGIIGLNSDYAFTVTNVITHGVPYLALVYWYVRARAPQAGAMYRRLARWPLLFLGSLWLMAYLEEMLWDRSVWHDRPWLFGASWELGAINVVVVPLLALPQMAHYLLDGFVWRRKNNPAFLSTK